MQKFLTRFAITEIVVKSAVIASLAIFSMSGRTDVSRMLHVCIYLGCVLAGYVTVRAFQKYRHLDVARWSYTRLSLILGIVFSILSSKIPGIRWPSIAFRVWNLDSITTIDKAAELLHGISFKLNYLIDLIVSRLFGDVVGLPIKLLLSTDVTYGFVVLPYSLLLVRLVDVTRGVDKQAPYPERG